MTVRQATYEAYKAMAPEFSILNLIRRVRELTERPALTDGSITRRLRELREDSIIDYVVTDSQRAIYQKKLMNSQLSLAL